MQYKTMHLSAERIIYNNKYILIYTDEDFLYLYFIILINPSMLHVHTCTCNIQVYMFTCTLVPHTGGFV